MATITGTSGNDQGATQLNGTSDADIINGLGGNDTIEGLGGADTIDGGEGVDTASYHNSTSRVFVNLGAGTASGGHAEGDVLISIENIIGSRFADVLTGDAGANSFSGEDGNDFIEGGGGADFIDGGAFVDSDWVLYFNSSAGVTVNLATFSGSGGDAEGDQIFNIENISGSNLHSDVLIGDSGANRLNGVGGNDTLTGGGGSDFIDGGSGIDTAVFAITRASATITQSGTQIIVTSAEGTDTLEGVEFLQFSDETVSVESLFPSAPTIQVTTFADTVDANDGVTSLREAVTQANAAGTQTIVQLGAGTYTLLQSDAIGTLDITGNVVLRGAGSTQTIIIDDIHGYSYRTLNVASGAVFGLEDVKLTDSSDNVESALRNDGGTVSITNSVIQDYGEVASDATASGKYGSEAYTTEGGAIFNALGSIDIVGSAFIGNKATDGGAIYAANGYVSVDSTSFDSNQVNGSYQSGAQGKNFDDAYDTGSGAAILSESTARIDIFADKSGSGTSTTFTNNTSSNETVVSLIEGNGNVYLDPAISVAGNAASALNGVVRGTPFNSAASAAQAAPAANAQALEPQAAEGDNPILTLASSLNLSVNNTDLAFVQNAILSQTGTEMVIQLAGHRVVLTGADLSYNGDPFGVTDTAALVAAAGGTISGLSITNADGSQTLGTLTGVSDTLDSLITNFGTSKSLAGALGTTPAQTGSSGNDTFDTTTGNDTVNGSGGTDTVVQGAFRANSAVTQNGTVLTVTGAGTDTFTDVERIQFQDGTLAFDLTGAAGQTFRLYRAAFDREPDQVGLAHNVNIMDGGLSIFDMANAFIGSAEFRQTYGEGIDNTTFLTLLYQNVLNRAPDQVGLNGWLGQLGSGETDLQHVLFGFSESAENKAATAPLTDDGIWLG